MEEKDQLLQIEHLKQEVQQRILLTIWWNNFKKDFKKRVFPLLLLLVPLYVASAWFVAHPNPTPLETYTIAHGVEIKMSTCVELPSPIFSFQYSIYCTYMFGDEMVFSSNTLFFTPTLELLNSQIPPLPPATQYCNTKPFLFLYLSNNEIEGYCKKANPEDHTSMMYLRDIGRQIIEDIKEKKKRITV